VIAPRTALDDEDTRLLTYQRAYAASVDQLDALASVSAGICASASGRSVPSDLDPAVTDQPDEGATDDLTYRGAVAALNGVVQRSLRDFVA